MAEPFKHLLGPDRIRHCGEHLQRQWSAFDRHGFEQRACEGLDSLEMKARSMQIADALEATLPDDFDTAAGIIEAALAPARQDDSLDFGETPAGLAGWIGWPLGEFIARRGLLDPPRALQALHALTQRFTGEFAIRPFLIRHFELTLETLRGWCDDPSPHVRRLVSEGSRPRLPWGQRIRRLVDDPTPTLPLLAALQDDDSGYVRRSVANHLNDIAKDHPGVVADWLQAHLPAASAQRRALLRHASRTLIKQGDPRVLEAWGIGRPFEGRSALSLSPRRVRTGDRLQLTLDLASTAGTAQALVIDYVVHHVRANGSTSPKVFKGWTLELPPRAARTLSRRHSLRPVTTRTYHAGEHRIDVQVNGVLVAHGHFHLECG